MKKRHRAAAWIAAGIVHLSLGMGSPAQAQTRPPAPGATQAEAAVVTHRASGTFEVKMAPLSTDAPLGRMSLDKQFHGDLRGTGKGEMLAAMTPVEGSAAYVAIEQVSGTLAGRTGTFVLQHTGVMNRGAQQLSITVVPDSGTGELAGISGRMNIIIAEGKHSYEFDYTLPAAP